MLKRILKQLLMKFIGKKFGFYPKPKYYKHKYYKPTKHKGLSYKLKKIFD
ncbi:MAG: hypothetical protein K1X72_05915 [Pyrinomonadaceae bacterium]|nr:hypothetical protein [Pyrinomonadaceae bacterium]